MGGARTFFPADAGENAKFAEKQEIEVDRLIVAGEMCVADRACPIALDVKDDIFFVFEAAGVFQRDREFPGIVMDGHLFGPGGAPDAKVAQRSLLAG